MGFLYQYLPNSERCVSLYGTQPAHLFDANLIRLTGHLAPASACTSFILFLLNSIHHFLSFGFPNSVLSKPKFPIWFQRHQATFLCIFLFRTSKTRIVIRISCCYDSMQWILVLGVTIIFTSLNGSGRTRYLTPTNSLNFALSLMESKSLSFFADSIFVLSSLIASSKSFKLHLYLLSLPYSVICCIKHLNLRGQVVLLYQNTVWLHLISSI